MKKFELIIGTLVIISLLYKLLFSTELNTLFIISLISLSLFYLYFSFLYFNNIPIKKAFKKDSYNGITKWEIYGSIGLGFGLSFTCLGILFSIMRWPMNLYNEIGILVLIVIGIVGLIKFKTNKTTNLKKSLIRILVIGGIGSIIWLTQNDTVKDILKLENPIETSIES
ncbi:MAG: hypothetical protein ACI8W0_000006 [Flavobacterium sp.]|jgi:hypothetical protein